MTDFLSKVIKRQRAELLQPTTSTFYNRTQLKTLQKAIDQPLTKVITGPRRCGKSTLARLAIKELKFAYLNFEDDGLSPGATGDEIISGLQAEYGEPQIYFFDEIQNMNHWEKFIHRLHREGKNCIVTGSNAHLLSSEIATALTGRHFAVELLPFSYQELISSGRADSVETFDRYLRMGGFPEVALNTFDSQSYLSTLWDSVVLKDVVRRHKVRNVAGLNDIYSLMLQGFAARFSFESLARAQGKTVSAPTIKNFLRFAHEAYLLAALEPFHYAARKRIKSDRKSYTYDNGYITAKLVSGSPSLGRLLENMVFCELVRRGFRLNIDLFYYVTSTGHEVDFLTRSMSRNEELIQVCWSLEDGRTRERELRSLDHAARELNMSEGLILTYDESEPQTTINNGVNIRVQSVREWLLQVHSDQIDT